MKRDLERIDRALKARAPIKKTPPPKVSTPSGPLPFISTEILSARIRIDRLCVKCRAIFVDLVDVTTLDLTAIFQGTKKAPDDFLSNAHSGLEILADENCPNCAK